MELAAVARTYLMACSGVRQRNFDILIKVLKKFKSLVVIYYITNFEPEDLHRSATSDINQGLSNYL